MSDEASGRERVGGDTDTSVPAAYKYDPTKRASPLTPRHEQAIRLYTCGKTKAEACRLAGMSQQAFDLALQSPEATKLMASVRGELDTRFQGLFEKVITVVTDGLEHPDPQVALASANLWLRSNKATKVEVALTAEDVIQKIMDGTLDE